MVKLELQLAVIEQPTPSETKFQQWAGAIQSESDQEVSLRIVDETEMVQLNQQYRKKTGPTNVLSFPADLPDGVNVPFLGDIIICAPVVAIEAASQGKSLDSHWAHMTVHGILHLQGYDHIDKSEAEIMENLEIQIMSELGFANPYA
jgi:probable rRNA maturation factor